MNAAFVTGPSRITIKDIDCPRPGTGEIRVKMDACGICGSDIEKVFGKYGQPSMRLGHEPAGTITELGSGVSGFDIGDRVFTHHHVPCYSCHLCKNGSETMCPKYYETNLAPCGLAQEYIVPEWNVSHGGVLKLPESMSFEEAAMIEPLACCIRSWNKIPKGANKSIAVLGAGPTGLMHVMLAQSFGFEDIFCQDVNRFRLDFAKKLGITESIDATDPAKNNIILTHTSGLGVDAAIVATGSLAAFQDAINMVRKGGTVVMFGVPSKGAAINLDMSTIYSKEISIVTSYAASDIDTVKAMEIISSNDIKVKDLITHKYDLSDSQAAFEHARDGTDAMKIVITGTCSV